MKRPFGRGRTQHDPYGDLGSPWFIKHVYIHWDDPLRQVQAPQQVILDLQSEGQGWMFSDGFFLHRKKLQVVIKTKKVTDINSGKLFFGQFCESN